MSPYKGKFPIHCGSEPARDGASQFNPKISSIRTEHGQSNYVRCRRIGSGNVDHGEISKSYWDLRSTVSVYAILALEPKLVFDFTGNVFKTGGVASTLSNSITA